MITKIPNYKFITKDIIDKT